MQATTRLSKSVGSHGNTADLVGGTTAGSTRDRPPGICLGLGAGRPPDRDPGQPLRGRRQRRRPGRQRSPSVQDRAAGHQRRYGQRRHRGGWRDLSAEHPRAGKSSPPLWRVRRRHRGQLRQWDRGQLHRARPCCQPLAPQGQRQGLGRDAVRGRCEHRRRLPDHRRRTQFAGGALVAGRWVLYLPRLADDLEQCDREKPDVSPRQARPGEARRRHLFHRREHLDPE